MILLNLIEIISHFLYIFINDKNVFQERIYYLFFILLFSKIILKANIYKDSNHKALFKNSLLFIIYVNFKCGILISTIFL